MVNISNYLPVGTFRMPNFKIESIDMNGTLTLSFEDDLSNLFSLLSSTNTSTNNPELFLGNLSD